MEICQARFKIVDIFLTDCQLYRVWGGLLLELCFCRVLAVFRATTLFIIFGQ